MSAATLARSQSAGVLGAPLAPQVNLLPPEIRSGRQLGRVKGWLGFALLVTVLVAGLLFLWATWTAKTVADQLAEAQDVNQSLLSQQAQYAEVPQVLGALKDSQTALEFGFSTETLWQPYLSALAATAPEGVSFDVLTVTSSTPMIADVSAVTASPLAAVGTVGTITFTARSLTAPDLADWLDALDAIPGFTDAWFDTAQMTDDQGDIFFQVNGSVKITSDAYAHRFVAPEED